MSRPYIQLFTPNFINAATQVSSAQVITFSLDEGRAALNAPAAASVKFTLSEAISFDTIYILNTNIKAITVINAGSTVLSTTAEGKNIVLNLPLLSSSEIVLTFSSSENIYADNIIFCRTILSLGRTKTSYSISAYEKGGSYYLNSGTLLCWQEYTKAQVLLSIDNASQSVKEKIKQCFDEYRLLTFAFDTEAVYEMALSKPMSARPDRSTGLFGLELSLTEK